MALARATTHTTAADGTFSSDGATAWNAAHTNAITGAVSGGIPYFDSTTSEATSALLAQYGVITGGGVGNPPLTTAGFTFGGAAAGTGLNADAGTATTDVGHRFTQTSNAAGVVFSTLKITHTRTASAAGSAGLDVFAGATNAFQVRIDGNFPSGGFGCSAANAFFRNSSNAGFVLVNATNGGYSDMQVGVFLAATNLQLGASDTNLSRVSAGVIGVGTGAAASVAGSLSMNNCKAVSYTVGTTAGASFGPGLPTSITIVNGIVTAAS